MFCLVPGNIWIRVAGFLVPWNPKRLTMAPRILNDNMNIFFVYPSFAPGLNCALKVELLNLNQTNLKTNGFPPILRFWLFSRLSFHFTRTLLVCNVLNGNITLHNKNNLQTSSELILELGRLNWINMCRLLSPLLQQILVLLPCTVFRVKEWFGIVPKLL
jgi:hypothetical protein